MKLPANPLPRTPLIAPLTYHSGTLRSRRFPLFSQWFPLHACAKAWCPRGGLGAPLGATGFSGKLFFSESLWFPTVSARFPIKYFQVLDASDRIPDITQRNAKQPWFPFVFPRVFAIYLCKSLVPARRPRGPARRHRI